MSTTRNISSIFVTFLRFLDEYLLLMQQEQWYKKIKSLKDLASDNFFRYLLSPWTQCYSNSSWPSKPPENENWNWNNQNHLKIKTIKTTWKRKQSKPPGWKIKVNGKKARKSPWKVLLKARPRPKSPKHLLERKNYCQREAKIRSSINNLLWILAMRNRPMIALNSLE